MSKDRYLNGHGIMNRTHELNDAMWDALPLAWLGASGAMIGIGTGWILVLHSGWHIGFAIALTVGGLTCGTLGLLPWLRAGKAVREHREAMEAETTARGRGWAQS